MFYPTFLDKAKLRKTVTNLVSTQVGWKTKIALHGLWKCCWTPYTNWCLSKWQDQKPLSRSFICMNQAALWNASCLDQAAKQVNGGECKTESKIFFFVFRTEREGLVYSFQTEKRVLFYLATQHWANLLQNQGSRLTAQTFLCLGCCWFSFVWCEGWQNPNLCLNGKVTKSA